MDRLTDTHINAELLRFALDRVRAYVYIKDTESRYVYANHLALQLFGETAESLAGKGDSDFFPADAAARLRAIDLRVLAGERTEEEIIVDDAFGQRRVYWEVKTPLRAAGDSGPIIGVLGISTDISQRKVLEDQLRKDALHDALTGLPNRRLLLDRLAQAMIRSERDSDYGAVLFVDLNNFKKLNDTMGHEAGDECLIEVARRLQGVTRARDTVARFGGDEFVVLLEGLGSGVDIAIVNAGQVVRKVEIDLSKPYVLSMGSWDSTVSVGTAFFSGAGRSAETILAEADERMYAAKKRG